MINDTKAADAEQARLDSLAAYDILDTEPEPEYDRIVERAARLCDCPIATITLVDRDRQWFKARTGTPLRQTSRELSLCQYTIRGQDALVIPDTFDDPLFARHPAVQGEQAVRFYAGIPLVMPGGQALGTLCVMDRQPRELDPAHLLYLQLLADQVVMHLTLRHQTRVLKGALRDRDEAQRALEDRAAHLAESQRIGLIGSWTFDLESGALTWSEQTFRIFGLSEDDLAGRFENFLARVDARDRDALIERHRRALSGEAPLDVQYRIRHTNGDLQYLHERGELRHDQYDRPVRLEGTVQDITELKTFEQDLQRTQTLTGIAGRLARVGGWSVDLATNQITLSPEILALHDLGPDTRLNLEESINFYAPEYRDRIRALFAGCVEDGHGYDEELAVITATGQRFWVRALGRPVFDDSGRVVRIDGAFQDVSEQRQAQQALREEKVRFEAAAKATADAIWDWNPATDRLWWSDTMEKLFGYRPQNLERDSRSWTTRIHPEDKKRVLIGIQQVIHSQESTWEAEYRFIRQDGSVAHVSDRGYVIRDEDGNAIRMVGGMSDITERRRSQAHLAHQAALLDKARDAIFVLDLDHNVTFWNQAAEQIYGWSREQALGRPLDRLLDEDPALLATATEELLATGEWTGRVGATHQDGHQVVSEAHWSRVSDDQGRPEAILAINTDITERLALEEQLQQSQRLEAVGQLTGGVAHDFNNLLTVILGNAELLEELLTDNDLRASARLILGAAERAAELTRRLLAFARRQPLVPRMVNVNELITDLESLLRRTLHENMDLRFQPCEAPWAAFIDAGQLESSVLNLCINARDAMAGGGRILVETANVTLDREYTERQSDLAPGDYVQVVVSDTGQGIPAEILEKVFDPFFTTKPKGKGTGLGLSMVYGFVKQSRGHIKIYSEVGEGTTVKLYLPRANRDAEPAPPPMSPVEFGEERETVLLVEDDDLVREHAQRLLHDLGYPAFSAANGDAALALLREHDDIQVLFTDVIMSGGLNGPQLARAALKLRPGLRVLYTSGYTENAIVHQGRLDPGVHLLEKPYQKADLERKLREILNEVPG